MRPRLIDYLAATFLQGVVLFITLWGGLRLAAAWRGAVWLRQLPLVVPWWYFALSGGAWAVSGLVLFAMWYTRHPWARRASQVVFLLFPLLWWVDREVFALQPFFRANRLFIGSGLVVVFGLAILAAEISGQQFISGEDHERISRPQD